MASPPGGERLKKELGLWDVYAVGTGATLSSGFFLLPGLAAVGAGPALPLSYLIAALFLFNFGTGPVKGFAVTLSIGILASMFTAVFVSRTIYMLAFAGREERVVPRIHDLHIELAVVLRVAPQCIFGHQCADDLLVVGLDKNGVVFHGLCSVRGSNP